MKMTQPHAPVNPAPEGPKAGWTGLTIREHFAIEIMKALAPQTTEALTAVCLADDLIAALNRKPGE